MQSNKRGRHHSVDGLKQNFLLAQCYPLSFQSLESNLQEASPIQVSPCPPLKIKNPHMQHHIVPSCQQISNSALSTISLFNATWCSGQGIGLSETKTGACWVTPQLRWLWANHFISLLSPFRRAPGVNQRCSLFKWSYVGLLGLVSFEERIIPF